MTCLQKANQYPVVPDTRFLLLLVFTLLVAPLRPANAATNEVDLRPVALWSTGLSGGIHSMLLQGDRLYVCHQASGLVIVDVSEPASPKTLGTFNSPGSAIGIAVVGNTAYLGDETKGLQVLDISDPAQPKSIGSFTAVSRSFRVAVRGQHVFLTDTSRGLLVLDVSDPTSPVKIGEVATGAGASDVAFAGDFAFLASSSKGVSVVNIQNPAMPALVTNLNLGTQSVGTVALNGNTLYASATSNGLLVLDVTEPATPVLVTNLVNGITGYGVAHAAGQIGLADNSGPFQLLHAATPGLPIAVGHFPVTGATSVAMDAQHAFVSSGSGTILVLALGEPANPQSVSALGLGNRDLSRRLYAHKPGALYLTRNNSLTTFNTTTPFSPMPTYTNTVPSAGPSRISFSGTQAVGVANALWLWTLDLADPLAPQLRGSLNTAPSQQDFVLDGSRGFSGGFNRLDWLDASNPSQPAFVASLTNAEVYRSLAVYGNHLFAVTQGPALQVFDVSVPQVFTLVTNLPLESQGNLFLTGNRLYLAQAQQPRLAIYSLADPANPTRVGAYTSAWTFTPRVERDGYLYGQITQGGFEVLDVRDPGNIHRVGGNSVPITSLTSDGNALYATTSTELRAFPFLSRTSTIRLRADLTGEGRVKLELRGLVGRTVALERAQLFGEWQPWRTLSLAEEITLIDDDASASTTFYRAVEP